MLNMKRFSGDFDAARLVSP